MTIILLTKNTIKMSEQVKSIEMDAVLLSAPSREFTGTNGSVSVLFTAEITSGPAKGEIVKARRTLQNSRGENKDNCAKGDKVTLHYSTFEDKDGNRLPSFQISTAITVADNDNILAKFDMAEVPEAGGEE